MGELPPTAETRPEQRDGPFSLRERIYLTYRYHGPEALALRALTFPLRFTPLAGRVRHLTLDRSNVRRKRIREAKRWYRRYGRHVTVVIPSYRDADHVAKLVDAIAKTADLSRVSIVVTDDASGAEHLAQLHQIPHIHVIEGETNAGFAANVNRGLQAADPSSDVLLLNSDVIPKGDWLACLQYTANGAGVGVVGAKLLYPDNRIQWAGTVRNLGAPEWFDHRYRFKPANWGPANVGGPSLAATGACMYITRQALNQVGLFDEGFGMAYEDVDYGLRAWQAGFQVLYEPLAVMYHLESVTRGTKQNQRELDSQRYFWEKWADWLDRRNVRTAEGKLRVIYVTEGTGVGGGHRVIFEHLNGLAARGHEVELWSLGQDPDWFDLDVPVRSFKNYKSLTETLAPIEAIKIATWWVTAHYVWRASINHGIPAYFVQDIESSYYADDQPMQDRVMDSYKHEFHYMTTSPWNRDRLQELGLHPAMVPPGLDLDTFRPLPDSTRAEDTILAVGRSEPLKNFGLTLAAWRALPEPRPKLTLFGIEPEVTGGDPEITYVNGPTDAEVNDLMNQASVFIQTSRHEGFSLPPLEAMATGAAVVCTDAHGNREFCRHEQNCLMPAPEPEAVAQALKQVLSDAPLRERLGKQGIKTAADYGWDKRIDALEAFLESVAEPRSVQLTRPTG
ncbi:MAG: glycosyltransferase [Solirubrobacterales bacterium]|nr:glycosyltransferase [Solirubrobacterales bacterium]